MSTVRTSLHAGQQATLQAIQRTTRQCYRSTRSISASCQRSPRVSNILTPPSHRNTTSIRAFTSGHGLRKEKPVDEEVEEDSDKKEPEKKEEVINEEKADLKSKTPAPIPLDGSGSSGAAGESGDGGGRRRGKQSTAMTKPSIPDVYPTCLAIPVSSRPLFPGFYKAITIKDPAVAAAVQELLKRGQPYAAIFLAKDPKADADVINSADDVYDVGTFCQITGAFPTGGTQGDRALQAVLYPHRRIKLSSLMPPQAAKAASKDTIEDKPTKDAQDDKQGDVVASFEESTETKQDLGPTAFLRKDWPVSLATVDNLEDEPFESTPTIKALVSEIVNTAKQIAGVNPLFRDHVSAFAVSSSSSITDSPAKLADFAAAVSGGEMEDAQGVLAALNIEQRLLQALAIIKKEFMNAELSSKLSKDVESSIQKRQRDYFLTEQLKSIRRELGVESDGKEKLIEQFKAKASKLAMPEHVKQVFDEELAKLGHLEPAASEFNVTRNYLDWLTSIPFGILADENFDIQRARTILDEDHYGMSDVKDRILEQVAVAKLKASIDGSILLLVGPPGVGKTSIAASIAKSLGRPYFRFSVGGLSDVSELKGHRRTYVGANAGKIVQALKRTGSMNPVIVLDELDKIGSRGYGGDPASALLEILDPEQQRAYLDHYLDVPIDLSNVLFIATANETQTLSRPLLDRTEIIELSGYIMQEKMAIAKRYLEPQAKEATGLVGADVELTDDAVSTLINSYCRESGVRSLKRSIEKVYRKVALKIVSDLGDTEDQKTEPKDVTSDDASKSEVLVSTKEGDATSAASEPPVTKEKPKPLKVPDDVHIRIDTSNLKEYLGPPIFTSDRLYEQTPPGVAMGLAWTSMGGSSLYIESILESALNYNSRPGLERTGNLKAVMKESTQIAYSFAKGHMVRRFPQNEFFNKAKVHLHCPEGAVQKDGPSAGITMATSLLSLALNKALDPTIAMTGELTLTGKVLRIGGLREKTVAARRAGATMVIFPKANLSDWIELPENIKEGIEGKPVDTYNEVFDLVFPNIDEEAANSLWQKQLAKPAKEESEKDD